MEKLYVLAGKARSGKDSTYEFIKEYYQDKKVINLMYGAWIKNYATMLSNWQGNEEDKPRELLQKIAVDSRNINPGYTIKRMEEDINILKNHVDIIVITDARMPEEVMMPKEKFKETITIKLARTNFETTLTEKQQNNITETALDNFNDYDYVLENDGTLEDLKEKVFNLLGGK